MIAKRAKKITPFIVMEILEKANKMARQGIDIMHLEIGEPDFAPPSVVTDEMCKALEDGNTHYTDSLGTIELREAISNHYRQKYNVPVSPEQILVTSGTSPAMFLLFSTILEAKDEVIISDPCYACYSNFIEFVNASPISVPVYQEDTFQYRTELIKKKLTKKTRCIMINSPANPTGNLLSAKRMKEIAELSPYIISDEIYHGLVYDGIEHSILEFTDNAFVFNGFSKLYAMTGLRLGYIIAPEKFIRPMMKIHQNFFISANSAVQKAAIAALNESEDDVQQMKATYDKRRIYMIKRLKELGFGITIEPTGAFYVFANAKHISDDSYKLAFDILEKAHVGVSPGIDFGANGEGYLRFSYANSIDNIKEGLDRIENYLAKI